MTEGNKARFVLTAILLIFNFNFGVIHCCSGGDSDETATNAPSATTPKDQCNEKDGLNEGGGTIDDETLPRFTWDITDMTNMSSGPFMLNVEFHDGMKDVAILFPSVYNDNGKDVIYTSILNGDLTNEDPVVEVSVNGNPGEETFDVTMHSKHHAGGAYQVKEGKTYEVVLDPCIHDGEAVKDSTDADSETSGTYSQNSAGGAPQSFTVTISFHYDNAFLSNVAGGNHDTAKQKVREIINLARPAFSSQSYQLGHRITLEAVDISHVDAVLTLQGNVEPLHRISQTNSQRKDADNYHYFTHDYNYGIGGVAYLGTVCSSTSRLRSAITEWIGPSNSRYSEVQCMMTFAHELGHSLNMPHDFCRDSNCIHGDQKNFPRKDNAGNDCWNQASIMDYGQRHVNKWSTCSKEHMNQMRFGGRCSSKGNGGNGGNNGGGGNNNPNCKDDQQWRYYCTNVDNYGGCNGRNSRVFQYYCRKTCNKC